jgi:argininosuccinate synthase
MQRIVLAYSGGLDTSVAIPWLAEQHGAQVVTVTMDLGQGKELEDARERALGLGAVRAHVLDLRAEFAREFILPALQAGAIYEDRYPLATALGRPLIAKHLVEIAHLEGATAVAHGCGTEKGNDAVRIDLAVRALDPALLVLAPLGAWDLSRAEKVAFAKARGIPVPQSADSPYSTDVNLWGRSIECGVLDDPWREPPEEIYQLTKSPGEAPNLPAYVEVEFEQGTPVAVNGVAMPLVELISCLETIAGAHGIGRIDMLENRLGETKSREIYEAPAGVLLHAAHQELQKYVAPRDLARLASDLGVKYADLVYNGLWYTPTREAIDALVAKVQQRVTGAIRLKLFKGDYRVVGRRSPFGLYDEPLATATVDRTQHPAPST